MIEPFETDDPHDRRFALGARPACSRGSTPRAWSRPPTPTRRAASRPWPREPDDEVALAVALAVRSLRHGSVCLELGEPDARGAARRADLAGRPAGRSGWPTSRLARAGVVRVEGDVALPRPLLARGVPGARRPGGAAGPHAAPMVDRRRLEALAVDPLRRPVRRAARGRADGGPAVDDGAHRRAGHRQDHGGGGAARPAGRPVRPSAPDRPHRADRQGVRPAPGGRPDRAGRAGVRRAPRRRRPAGRPRRCTGCSGGSAAAATGSATTAATGCRTT